MSINLKVLLSGIIGTLVACITSSPPQVAYPDNLKVQFFVATSTQASNLHISLRPEDSDRMINNLILRNLVGGLTTLNASGKTELNLAREIKSEQSGRTWTFELRDKLSCDDGSKIDAESFANGLKRQLRQYAQMSRSKTVLNFDDMIGIREFLENATSDLKGLKVRSENQLEFSFRKRPASDFLETLSEPYFGYWCANNFTNPNFPKTKIVSSNTYLLESIADESLVLKIRSDWHRFNPKAPAKIEIRGLGNSYRSATAHSIIQAGMVHRIG